MRLLSPPGVATVDAGREPGPPASDRVQCRCLSKQQPGVSAAARSLLHSAAATRESVGAVEGRERPGRRPIRAGRYGAAILLHCVSADCLSEAIGIFAAAVRQACLAVLSAALTFALLVVI